MLKPFLLACSVILFFEITLAPAAAPAPGAPSQDAAPASTNPVKATAGNQERAKKLYAMDCALCHGDNGNGKNDMAMTLDDWTNPATLSKKSDKDLFDTIRKGKDKMPPEDEGRAKNDDVWALIHYIRNFSKGGVAPAPAPAPDATAPAPADKPSN